MRDRWLGNGSRMSGDVHVRFWESREVQFLPATQPVAGALSLQPAAQIPHRRRPALRGRGAVTSTPLPRSLTRRRPALRGRGAVTSTPLPRSLTVVDRPCVSRMLKEASWSR